MGCPGGKLALMSAQKPLVDYDAIAPHYDVRYEINELPGIAGLLRQTVAEAGGPNARVLEGGCGTGHWLDLLGPLTSQVARPDFSAGMLRRPPPGAGQPPRSTAG